MDRMVAASARVRRRIGNPPSFWTDPKPACPTFKRTFDERRWSMLPFRPFAASFARHDRRRHFAGLQTGPASRPSFPRPSQGPRVPELHRGLRALLLLFDADAACPLHGQIFAASGQRRECHWARMAADAFLRRAGGPTARLGDLRYLHVARL